MSYTLDRFPERDKPVLEAVKDTLQSVVVATNMARFFERDTKRRQNNKHAKLAMLKIVSLASKVEGPEEQEFDLLGKVLGRVLKFVGRKFIKTVVRPILTFAGRVAMNIIRIAATTVLRVVIMPILTTVVTFVLANPISLAIGAAVIAAGAGGYYLWNKFFGEPSVAPKIMTTPVEAPEVEVEPGTIDEELGGPAVVEGAAEVPTATPPEPTVLQKATEVIAKPIEALKRFVAPKAKKGKFTGFGSDIDSYIKEASSKFPILPEDVLRGFIKMEAGWTGAMSPTGAIGTGQFTAGTWNALIPQGGAALGMVPLTGVYNETPPKIKPNPKGNFRTEQDPRFNRRVNTLATALLASQNAGMLKRAGLPITGENLYMMHNIGPGIIPVMQGQPASEKTLLAMRQNGMLPNMTAQQFLAYQKGRFGAAYEQANTKTDMVADQPQMADAKTVTPLAKVQKRAPPKASTVVASTGPKQGDLIRGPGKTIVSA